jgi:hypothetical protein
MTQEQLLQVRAKAIVDYEQEIIELKHLNQKLSDEISFKSSAIDYLNGQIKISFEDRNTYMNHAFFLGVLAGAILTVVIIALI